MTRFIDYFDSVDGVQKQRPTTADEDAAFDAQAASADQYTQAQIVRDVQARLDAFASEIFVDAQGRVHGDYDGVNSVSKYANLTDAQIAAMPAANQAMVTMFRTDCQYLVAATALTWATLYALQAQVQAGNWPTTGANQKPSGYADIAPSLPVLAWPA